VSEETTKANELEEEFMGLRAKLQTEIADFETEKRRHERIMSQLAFEMTLNRALLNTSKQAEHDNPWHDDESWWQQQDREMQERESRSALDDWRRTDE